MIDFIKSDWLYYLTSSSSSGTTITIATSVGKAFLYSVRHVTIDQVIVCLILICPSDSTAWKDFGWECMKWDSWIYQHRI